jgi:signal transduction histidine kinase
MSPGKQPRSAASSISGPIVVATLLIVISFLASLVISQFRLRNIDQRAFTIFEDALPSMEHLANLRTELHRLGMYVSEYVSHDSPGAVPSHSDISEVRAAIDAELLAYRTKPLFSQERTALERIQRELASLDDAVAQTLQLTDSGPELPAQQQWLLQDVHARLESADEAVLGLRQEQVRLVRLDTERILAAREASLTLAMVMGSGSLLLALLVSAFVVLTLRERVRLTEANDRLMLQHANRLATVGQLAAGLAHELGTPLQVVAGRAKAIATGKTEGAPAREAGAVILGQAQRMTKIIRGLLDFARRRPAERQPVELGELAAETVRVLEPMAHKRSVELALEVKGSAPVEVDRMQLQQALTNLVVNAMQAVPEGGHVTVRAERARALAALIVDDDGPGISKQAQARVFEPFFTTKDVGEGSGLGLAIADGLVRENGGWIDVSSEEGHGARFSIFLPCQPVAVEAAAAEVRS